MNLKNISLSKGYFRLSLILILLAIAVSFYGSLMAHHNFHKKKRAEYEVIYSSSISYITNTISYVEHFVNFMAQKISKNIDEPVNKNNLPKIASILLDAKNNIDESRSQIMTWTLFDFVMPDGKVVATSIDGILESPKIVEEDQRLWMKFAQIKPWVGIFCPPDAGIDSGEHIIPYGIGITDRNNKFLGIVSMGFSVDKIKEQIKTIIAGSNKEVILLDKDFNFIFSTNLKETKFTSFQIQAIKNLLQNSNQNKKLTINNILYSSAKNLEKYPFIILVGQNQDLLNAELRERMFALIMQNILLIIFFAIVLFFLRKNVINPIAQLSDAARKISRGDADVIIPQFNSLEFAQLGHQLRKVGEYIGIKLQKERAEEKSAMKTNFLLSVSHELRAMISNILNASEVLLMKDCGLSEEDKEGLVYDIKQSSLDLSTFIDDLLDIEQAETGNFFIEELVPLNSIELTQRALKLIKSKAIDKKISIIDEFSNKDLPLILCDGKRFRQIMVNLITNSIKYSPRNTQITIFARALSSEDRVEIIVSDQGVGMNKKELDMALVGKGREIEKELGGEVDSHGIGLPLVVKLTQLQEASINIESEKGNGTKVTLLFKTK